MGDSFVSASDGEYNGSAAYRPSLPRLQQRFSENEVPQVSRPSFLPPQQAGEQQVEDTVETRDRLPSGDDSEGMAPEDELFSWLSLASGAEPENVTRIVAWLGQLLNFSAIDELRDETEATMERLPEAT